MLDYSLEAAFAAVLKTAPALAAIRFYTGHDGETRHTPSITVESKSDAIAGSAVVFRSELSLVVETDANDTMPENHTALVQNIRDALADKSALGAAINAGGAVKLYGFRVEPTVARRLPHRPVLADFPHTVPPVTVLHGRSSVRLARTGRQTSPSIACPSTPTFATLRSDYAAAAI